MDGHSVCEHGHANPDAGTQPYRTDAHATTDHYARPSNRYPCPGNQYACSPNQYAHPADGYARPAHEHTRPTD